MDSFLSIENDSCTEQVIERSRFITHVFYVETEEDARQKIDFIRKKYADATHNCYAYVTDYGNATRSSDDGEPSGTAGVPILEVIRNKKIINVLVVVTRYFGGIKLGAGGLVRAYSGSCRDGLDKSVKKEFFMCKLLSVNVKYEEFNLFNSQILKDAYFVVDKCYGEDIKVVFAFKKSAYKPFIDKFSKIYYDKNIEEVGEGYY